MRSEEKFGEYEDGMVMTQKVTGLPWDSTKVQQKKVASEGKNGSTTTSYSERILKIA